MKKIKTIIPALLVAITISSCYKKPEASFTINKTEYIAGDTVHLTNTSTNGHSYLWALPDGGKLTTTNADYVIPRNQGFAQLTFILNAYSKKEKKNSTITKTIDVIPASMFAVDSPAYYYFPLNVQSPIFTNNNWGIYASVGNYENSTSSLNAAGYLRIFFSGTTAPTSGTYLLQPNDTLSPGHACAMVVRQWWEYGQENYYSLSGQLYVTVTNGKTHVIFNQIATVGSNKTISSDVTCP